MLTLALILLVTGLFPPLTAGAHLSVFNPPPGTLNLQSVSSATVTSAAISADDNYTYLVVSSTQPVTFTFGYSRNAVNITINQAHSFPTSVHMGANPIFSSAQWNGSTITLNLTTQDGFMGYHGYRDSAGNLVVRFRNPPSSIWVTRVVIDPGHGGQDRGAEGFRRDMPEVVINRHIASFLAEDLRNRGATVLVLDTSRGMELAERVRRAEEFNADFFISVHNNASRNANATGTEVFFFTQFSSVLAATVSRNVSQQLNTNNRRGRRARFAVTRSTQFQSILVEGGFMTNRAEYEKLINPHYQQAIATGIADAIEAVVAHSYPGTGRMARIG
ncbi:MAG: N-acetylmuramoyl-L-alanine amidase [Oscillospiraceae bacterium]|nr:N-acetylmuramoyl-L-alanine amidase [Oscillospiraceae bacterium]